MRLDSKWRECPACHRKHTCTVYTSEGQKPPALHPRGWGPAQPTEELGTCLTTCYPRGSPVCPARTGAGQQHGATASGQQLNRSPASPVYLAGQCVWRAAGELMASFWLLVITVTFNLSAKASCVYFPGICAVHGRVIQCLPVFPAVSNFHEITSRAKIALPPPTNS